jgi:hypothetical protein
MSAVSFQFRYQQDDLARICSPPENLREEYYSPNTFYGIGSVFRRYGSLPDEGPLPFVADPIVPWRADEPHKWDLRRGLPVFLAATTDRARVYEAREGAPKAVPVGFAFLYAMRLYERLHGRWRNDATRKGTIVFPHKSTELTRRDFDRATFARWLAGLPQEFQPVYINIYWQDYLHGHHREFEDAGLRVVSCGHRRSEDFLLRFYDLCRQFKYSCANAFASSMPLSVLSGCHFIYKETGEITEEKPGEVARHDHDVTLDTPWAQEAAALSPWPPRDGDQRKQLALARKLAGWKHVRSAWRLRRIFRKAQQHLLKSRGASLDFEQGPTLTQIHAWLVEGIEPDGWARVRASIAVPAGMRDTVFAMTLEFPHWAGLAQHRFTVSAGNSGPLQFETGPGRYALAVPLPAARGDVRLRLEGQDPFVIPNDGREVIFRILRFGPLEEPCAAAPSLNRLRT